MKNKNHIESVRIETVSDSDPDTSYIGEFTDDASPEAFIRFGEHYGKQVKDVPADEFPASRRAHEYRYFLADMTGEQTGNPDSPRQDWQCMESLHSGQWQFVGIIAKAVVVSASGVTQTLRSGGLWGIESDSDADYLAEVGRDELAALRSELEAFGFSARAISYAFRNVRNS